MKHTSNRQTKLSGAPVFWREAEYAARRINAEDTCDDRVSENIFDVEDERTAVDTIIHGMGRDLN